MSNCPRCGREAEITTAGVCLQCAMDLNWAVVERLDRATTKEATDGR